MKLEQAEAALMRLVESGRFGPGGRLPPERELCGQLGISRSTLRKALDLLEARGKIWRHVGRGTFVGSRANTAGARCSSPIARPKKPAAGLMDIGLATNPMELMELRLMLEPQVARIAAVRASPDEIAYMLHCVRKCELAADSGTYELWDGTLHNAVAEATHNSLLVSVLHSANELRKLTAWGRLRDAIVSPRDRLLHWSRQHRAFVEAIAERNPERAERLARVHVEEVFRRITDATHEVSSTVQPSGLRTLEDTNS